jgi:hypothetical protein
MHGKFPSVQVTKTSIFSGKISITWKFTIFGDHPGKISIYAWKIYVYAGKFSKTSIFSGKFSINFLIFIEIIFIWYNYMTSVVKYPYIFSMLWRKLHSCPLEISPLRPTFLWAFLTMKIWILWIINIVSIFLKLFNKKEKKLH